MWSKCLLLVYVSIALLAGGVQGDDGIVFTRANQSAVGTHFDVEWEVGWPGLNPTCNGFLLWTLTNYNDIPLVQGAPGPYAVVLPNGVAYQPYFSWGFKPSGHIFPRGMVLPISNIGWYMNPLDNATIGLGLSCKSRCPCSRIPSAPIFIGNGTLPGKDDGPSTDAVPVIPGDLIFNVARSNPSAGPKFDASWIDSADMCTGQMIYDIQNLNNVVIDASVPSTWTVSLPPTLFWADPTSWGFDSTAFPDDTGTVAITNIGFYMSPAGMSGDVAKAAFALTIKCSSKTYINNTNPATMQPLPCWCPATSQVIIAMGAVFSVGSGTSSYTDLANLGYALIRAVDPRLTGSFPVKGIPSIYGRPDTLTWDGAATLLDGSSAVPGVTLFYSGFTDKIYATMNAVKRIQFTMPAKTTAFTIYVASFPGSAQPSDSTELIAKANTGATGNIPVTFPAVTSPTATLGRFVSFRSAGGKFLTQITLEWNGSNNALGFLFGGIQLSFTSVNA